jgi:FKBP-type peptidyl-prolyl cis-trans isomerase
MTGCAGEKYQDFSAIGDGVFYRLHSFGESNRKPEKGDFLHVKLRCYKGDTLIAESIFPDHDGFDTLSIKDPAYDLLSSALIEMEEGDSASIIFDTKSPFDVNDSLIPSELKTVPLRLEIRLVDLKEEKIVKKERLLHSLWIKEKRADELKLIKDFVQENNISAQPDRDNFYFIPVTDGHGESPKPGQLVTINYNASFISGKEFYSTFASNDLFEFVMGAPGQLLPGMERGISKMREGSKARFIVPSHLAFGETGSSTGLVGPFKTLIFDVELVSIK